MPTTIKSLEDLAKDNSFINDLKNCNFCLVLGAGFSFGKNESNRLRNRVIRFNSLYHHIPLTKDFIEITKLEFKQTAIDFQNAVILWEKSIKVDAIKRELLRNLFLLDEEDFNKRFLSTYKCILIPDWYRVFTFNFDNVFEAICQHKEYEPLSYPDDKEFTSNKSKEIAHVHGRITEDSDLLNLVFFGNKYALLHNSTNDLYYSLLNSVNSINQPKNLLILGCQFNEVIQIQKFFLGLNIINRPKIYQIDITEPNFSGDRENYDYIFVKASTFQFLEFLKENKSKIEKPKKLPDNLILLKKEENKTESLPIKFFSDFLDSKHLKYLSRYEFKNQLKNSGRFSEEELKYFFSENDMLGFIFSNNYYGLVIHGKGGIGKTRLMLELGKRLLKKKYIVIEVKSNFNNIQELISYITPEYDNKYVLLFDYIEEQRVFDQIISWVINNRKENIKIIANCRNTIRADVEYMVGTSLKFIDIDAPQQTENKYKRAIINTIISSINDPLLVNELRNKAILRSFYEAKPSFAAFIKYINAKGRPTKLKFVENETFKLWLLKRLNYTVNKQSRYNDLFETKKYIFQILSCLPAGSLIARQLKNIDINNISFANEINNLIKDGWIDETLDSSLKVVHDTVNDALLLQFFNYFRFDSHYLNDFLEFAVKIGNLSSMMWSFQRIWGEIPNSRKLPLQKFIAQFIDIHLNATISKQDWFKYKMDNTQLITEEDRIGIFIKHKNLLLETFALEKYGSSLAFSMEWIFENLSDKIKRDHFSKILKDLFFHQWNINGRYNSFTNDPRGGKILSSYINLFGIDDYIMERFHNYFQRIECNVKTLEPISLAIVSWINQNGIITARIREMISLWFTVYFKEQPENINPEYLIRSSISKGINIISSSEFIEPNKNNLKLISYDLIILLEREDKISPELRKKVISWFEIFEREKNDNINPVSLTITWLEKGGEALIVQNVIRDILTNPLKSPTLKAKCIGLWLQKSDNPGFVKPFIYNILNQDIIPETACFIIGNWLQKSEDPLFIKPFLNNSLYYNVKFPIFLFLLNNWLDKGDDPNIVRPIFSQRKEEFLKWLSENTNNKQGVYSLGIILEFLADKSLLIQIQNSAADLIKNFASTLETGFCIGYWIEKGGNLIVVEPSINQWLSLFANSAQGFAIIGQWLESGGNPSKVKEFIIPLLQTSGKEKWASHLMFNWVKHGDDPYLIKDFIKPFFELKENQKRYEHRHLITSWLDLTNMPLLVKDAIKPWLKANHSDPEGSIWVCTFWIQKGDEIKLVEDYIKDYFFDFVEQKDSNQVIENWIEKGGDLGLIQKSLTKFLNKDKKDSNTLFAARKWMEKDGNLKALEQFIKTKFILYLKNNLNCSSIIFLWLNKGGDPHLIKPAVIEFLRLYGEERNVSSVLSCWIEKGKDISSVKNVLLKWLQLYSDDQYHASLVLAAALEINEGFQTVRNTARQWLSHYGNTADAKYPLSSWLKHKGNEGGKDIDNWIVYWVENHYNPINTDWRDDLLLNYVLSVREGPLD